MLSSMSARKNYICSVCCFVFRIYTERKKETHILTFKTTDFFMRTNFVLITVICAHLRRELNSSRNIFNFCDDFDFHITNFPFLSSNIPTSPAYGVFISQLIRYARACSSYGCFILRATLLSNKLLEQGYVKERLKSSLRKLYGRYGDLIKQYEVSL